MTPQCLYALTPIPLRVVYGREGFPLTGLFHPWAQWDMGLDTLGNSSRRAAVAVAPLVGWREAFYKKTQMSVGFPPKHILCEK